MFIKLKILSYEIKLMYHLFTNFSNIDISKTWLLAKMKCTVNPVELNIAEFLVSARKLVLTVQLI